MDPHFLNEISMSDRRIFNLFINSAVTTQDTQHRLLSMIDMFPNILASLNVQVEGEGTNAFSNVPSLIEIYGLNTVNEALALRSEFYIELLVPSNTDD